MRYNEIIKESTLLEFNVEKTITNFGPKILVAAQKDPQLKSLGEDQAIINHVIEQLQGADPTKNNQYMIWLIREFIKGVKLEDLMSRGADALADFVAMRKANKVPAEMADIGRLSFTQLEDLTANYQANATPVSKVEPSRGKYETIHRGEDCLIIHPQDIQAAIFYGQGTKWCTAARNNNMFNSYNQSGPLYIIIPKEPKYNGEKYQIHLATEQYMNEKDKKVDIAELICRFPVIADVCPDENFKSIAIFARGDAKEVQELINNNPDSLEVLPKSKVTMAIAKQAVNLVITSTRTYLMKTIPQKFLDKAITTQVADQMFTEMPPGYAETMVKYIPDKSIDANLASKIVELAIENYDPVLIKKVPEQYVIQNITIDQATEMVEENIEWIEILPTQLISNEAAKSAVKLSAEYLQFVPKSLMDEEIAIQAATDKYVFDYLDPKYITPNVIMAYIKHHCKGSNISLNGPRIPKEFQYLLKKKHNSK